MTEVKTKRRLNIVDVDTKKTAPVAQPEAKAEAPKKLALPPKKSKEEKAPEKSKLAKLSEKIAKPEEKTPTKAAPEPKKGKKKKLALAVVKKDEPAQADDEKPVKESGLGLFTDKKLGRVAKNLGITISVRSDEDPLPFVRVTVKVASHDSLWFTHGRFENADEKASLLAAAEHDVKALVAWVKENAAKLNKRAAEEKEAA